MNSWHKKLGGKRKAGNTASQFSIGIHFLIHNFLATNAKASLPDVIGYVIKQAVNTFKHKKKDALRLNWFDIYLTKLSNHVKHSWHMEVSPATHGHGKSRNNFTVPIIFIGPRTRKNTIKLFHRYQRTMPNTNHFSVPLLILSLLLTPKL